METFGIVGMAFGIMGFIFAINASAQSKSLAKKVDEIESSLKDTGNNPRNG